MSKIESGRIVLSEEDFLLDSLFKDVISMIQPDLKRRGHTLNIHIETLEHEAVCGDMQRLQQIINNLLSNAIKYTPHGRDHYAGAVRNTQSAAGLQHLPAGM